MQGHSCHGDGDRFISPEINVNISRIFTQSLKILSRFLPNNLLTYYLVFSPNHSSTYYLGFSPNHSKISLNWFCVPLFLIQFVIISRELTSLRHLVFFPSEYYFFSMLLSRHLLKQDSYLVIFDLLKLIILFIFSLYSEDIPTFLLPLSLFNLLSCFI